MTDNNPGRMGEQQNQQFDFATSQLALLQLLQHSTAIIQFSPTGTILSVNDNYKQLSGYSEDELLGQQHRIFCTAEEAMSRDYTEFWHKLRQGQHLRGKFCRKRRDNNFFWIEAAYSPIYDQDNKLVKIVKLANDITAVTEQAKEYASKLEAISRAMLVGEFSPEGLLLTANDNFLSAYKYSRDEIVGQQHSFFCPPEYSASSVYADFWQQLRAGNFISAQVQRLDSEGGCLYLEANYNPIFDITGKLAKIVKYATNITQRLSHEAEEHQEIRRLSQVVDGINNPILVTDSHFCTEYVNSGFSQTFGYSSEEMKGHIPHNIFGPDSEKILALVRSSIKSGQVFTAETLTYGRVGQRFWNAVSVAPILDAGAVSKIGSLILRPVPEAGAVFMFTDITATKVQHLLQEKALEAVAHELSITEVMTLICQEVETAAPELRIAIHGIDVNQCLYPLAAPGFSQKFRDFLRGVKIGLDAGSWGQAAFTGEQIIVSDVRLAPCWQKYLSNLQQFDIHACCSTPFFNSGGDVLGTVTICMQHSRPPDQFHLRILDTLLPLCTLAMEREKSRKTMRQLAFYDTVTALPNRQLLLAKLDLAIVRARNHDTSLAILVLALDDHRRASEILKPDDIDQFIRTISDRISDNLKPSDIFGRISEDKFALFVTNLAPEKINELVLKLQRTVAYPCNFTEIELSPTITVGVSLFPDNGEDSETLLRHADMALNQAKRQGKGSFGFFSEDINRQLQERISIESSFRETLRQHGIVLNFQPQVNMRDHSLHGFEVLSRWSHPQFGVVSPERFIPLAEECGLIGDLSHLVLTESCKMLGKWQSEGLPIPALSVNLSPSDFHQPDLLEFIGQLLTENNLSPQNLVLEITEGVMLDNNPNTWKIITNAHESGFKLSMDDFGTGYSSLSYLRRLPISELKLDKSFVNGIETDQKSRDLSNSVIRIGDSLQLTVVAEGVETNQQFAILREQGYHVAQGYLHSKPLPATDVPGWLTGFINNRESRNTFVNNADQSQNSLSIDTASIN